MRRLLATTCAVLLLGPTAAGAEPVTRVLVRFAADASPAQRAAIRSDAGVERAAPLPVKGLEVVDPKSGVTVGEAVSDLEHRKGVLYAEPDQVRTLDATPNDPLYDREWGLGDIEAPVAWDVTTGSPQVTVAVVDTGIDAAHPDLAANTVPGWDFVDGDAQPQDGNGHGTHVAGTIAARGNDGFGVTGVGWTTRVMALRVLDNSGEGFVSDAVSAYGFAASHGARVLNASLGGPSFSRAERDAIAAAPNTLFVVAAGNDTQDNDTIPDYPCDYDLANIVCVAASDSDGALGWFSNYGATTVDLAAPGVGVLSTWPGARFAWRSGTSMATPHVSGAAALLLARNPTLDVAGLRSLLLSSVTKLGGLAGSVVTGGKLDLAAAIAATPAPPPPAPPAAPAPAPAPVAQTAAASAVDRTAPTVALQIVRARLGAVRKRGLRVVVTVSEACATTIAVQVDRRTRKRLHLRSGVIGRASVRLRAAGRRTATVRLTARARRALRRTTRVRVVARALATDLAGNRRNASGAATLRR
jgi:subtilisin family serine protease